MKLAWQVHTIPKAGCKPEENEDAFAIAKETARVAICDGASEGWGSGPWAQHLANSFVSAPADPQSFGEWLMKVRLTASNLAPPVISWYAEEKSAQGAYCTLLSMNFSLASDGGVRYHAVAVGDSNMVHMREGRVLARFPMEKSSAFSNRPALVGSTAESGNPEPDWFAGRAEAGDRFYLCTDAVAEWFLAEAEADEEPWAAIDAVTSAIDAAAEFADWVQSLRASKRMRNDDATLVRVRIL